MIDDTTSGEMVGAVGPSRRDLALAGGFHNDICTQLRLEDADVDGLVFGTELDLVEHVPSSERFDSCILSGVSCNEGGFERLYFGDRDSNR